MTPATLQPQGKGTLCMIVSNKSPQLPPEMFQGSQSSMDGLLMLKINLLNKDYTKDKLSQLCNQRAVIVPVFQASRV